MLLVFSAFCHEHSYTLCLPRMMSHCASRSARLLVLLVLHVTLLARTTDSFPSKAVSLETVTLRYSIYIYIYISRHAKLDPVSHYSLSHSFTLRFSFSLSLSFSFYSHSSKLQCERFFFYSSIGHSETFENCPQQYTSSPRYDIVVT